MEIYIDDRQESLPVSHQAIRQLVLQTLALEGVHCDEVGIHLVEVPEICELHAHHFNDPSVTDCISFPINNEFKAVDSYLLGDVFICPQVAIDYAKTHQGNPYEELALYIIHGLLHLIGYDDIDATECNLMRLAEEKHMKNLKNCKVNLSANREI